MAASMIIPFQAIMIPLVSIYGSGLHLLNHRLTLIFMHTGFALSMSVFIYQGFIKSGIPISLEEAAYLDGCTNVQTFFKVVFPLLKHSGTTICFRHWYLERKTYIHFRYRLILSTELTHPITV